VGAAHDEHGHRDAREDVLQPVAYRAPLLAEIVDRPAPDQRVDEQHGDRPRVLADGVEGEQGGLVDEGARAGHGRRTQEHRRDAGVRVVGEELPGNLRPHGVPDDDRWRKARAGDVLLDVPSHQVGVVHDGEVARGCRRRPEARQVQRVDHRQRFQGRDEPPERPRGGPDAVQQHHGAGRVVPVDVADDRAAAVGRHDGARAWTRVRAGHRPSSTTSSASRLDGSSLHRAGPPWGTAGRCACRAPSGRERSAGGLPSVHWSRRPGPR